MSWFSKKSTQDYGEYLPDEEATLQEENIHIQASSDDKAQQSCKEEARKYDGFDAKAEKSEDSDKDYNCKFKFWG